MIKAAREEGFSLIELLVAITLIGIIMTGLASGLITALTVTRDSRERTIAANLASEEIGLAHAVPITDLREETLERVERVGQTDFTIRRVAAWGNGAVQAQSCTALANSASGQGRRFLQVNVEVTWDDTGLLRAPVRASTAITPSIASYRAGFGAVAAEVKDRDDNPVQGITVRLVPRGDTPPLSSPPPVTTTSIGCAFFSDVPPGSWTVEVDQPGYVDADPEDRAQLGREDVEVGERATARALFTYDQRAGLDLTLSSPDGGEVPDGVLVVAEPVAATTFLAYSGPGSGGSRQRTIGVAPGEGLFPYTGGWTAWAGCGHNDPGNYGGGRLPLNPAPGQTVTDDPATEDDDVRGGTLRIRFNRTDAARAGQQLYAVDIGAASGSPCEAAIDLGPFLANGTFSRDVVLPFGDWQLYAGMTVLDTDPTLTDPPGVVRVRPGQVASYVEPLRFDAAVLADGPFLYYRLDDPPFFGTGASDSSGNGYHGTYQSGITARSTGALPGEANPAIDIAGGWEGGPPLGYLSTPVLMGDPDVFTFELWFSTTSTSGGRLAGFGENETDWSYNYDRHLYMLDTGELVFGAYLGEIRTLQSPGPLNDGLWHHAVATMGPGGAALYVDGALVASDPTLTDGQDYSGYVRVGTDNLDSWPGPWSSYGFSGSVDEFAFYLSPLSAARVSAHYNARTGTSYRPTVLTDVPLIYYRFGGGSTARDSSGNNRHGVYQGGATGTTGAVDGNGAIAFDGSDSAYVSNATAVTNPRPFSLELWFRTAPGYARGGRMIGLGNASTGLSTGSDYDRLIYMTNAGRVIFGVRSGGIRTIQSPAAYNDGQWHHVVATLRVATGAPANTAGMRLYVDGQQVASNASITSARNFTGYWRVGADTLSGWTSVPTSRGLAGDLDEAVVYTTALTPQQVAAHYAASGR